MTLISVNSFTAPACKIFRLKDGTDAPANSIFSGPITSVFNAVGFDGTMILSHASAKKEDKKAQ